MLLPLATQHHSSSDDDALGRSEVRCFPSRFSDAYGLAAWRPATGNQHSMVAPAADTADVSSGDGPGPKTTPPVQQAQGWTDVAADEEQEGREGGPTARDPESALRRPSPSRLSPSSSSPALLLLSSSQRRIEALAQVY